jgi:sulfate transport system permease protein
MKSTNSCATQEPALGALHLLTIGLGFLFFFLGLPLVAVFVEAWRRVPIYLEALKESETRSAIWLTVVIALAVLPFNILFGVAAAWAIAKFEFKGKSLLITLIDLPFAVVRWLPAWSLSCCSARRATFGDVAGGMTSRSSSPCPA